MSHRKTIVAALVPVYLVLIGGLPLVAAVLPVIAAPTWAWRTGALLAALPVFLCCYVLVAATLSRLTRRAIVAGRFPRDLGHEVYGPRRLYAICWTAIYFCAPVYHAVLAVPTLKRITFRLFGYKGSLNFQTYPDTWIRDLPLLHIGEGAYLSNKATISPNMCLQNGSILIREVTIGARTMIGHLSMIAPGVTIGEDSEVGVGAGIGVNVRIGSRTHVDHTVVVDHSARIGDDCVVGTRAYIGRGAFIGDGVKVPPGAMVPSKVRLATPDEAEAFFQTREHAGTPAYGLRAIVAA